MAIHFQVASWLFVFAIANVCKYYTNFHLLHALCTQQEPAQNLRSALEQKARQQPSPSSGPPKRKMKPGQAKTLSDLPQLSA